MKESSFVIRPAVDADLVGIAELLNHTFANLPFDIRKKIWQWRYYENPARIPSIPLFLVAEKDSKVVGVHGFIPAVLKIGKDYLNAAYACDFAVSKDIKGIGLKLKMEAMSKSITDVALSSSGNAQANKIVLALGGNEVSAANTKFIKPLRTYKFFLAKINNHSNKFIRGMLWCVASVVDLLLSLRYRIVNYETNNNYADVIEIYNFDASFETLWDKISQRYSVWIKRDTSYLNWRYFKYPFPGIRVFSLKNEGEILGYIAISMYTDSRGLRAISILDLITLKENDRVTLSKLLSKLFREASSFKADYVRGQTGDSFIKQIYLGFGFKRRSQVFSPYTYRDNTNRDKNTFKDWYISFGDGDVDYFYPTQASS